MMREAISINTVPDASHSFPGGSHVVRSKDVRCLRGASVTVAHVLLLAVTLSLAAVTVTYVVGIFSNTTKNKPLVAIMPDSYINVSDIDNYNRRGPSIRLHVVNHGADARVYKIVVDNIGEIRWFYLVDDSMSPKEAYQVTRGAVSNIIPANSDVWIIAMIRNPYENPVPGNIYRVDIYTADGSVFSTYVTAK